MSSGEGFFGGDPEKDVHLSVGDQRRPGQRWEKPKDEQELLRDHAEQAARKARKRDGWRRRISEVPKKILRRLQRN